MMTMGDLTHVQQIHQQCAFWLTGACHSGAECVCFAPRIVSVTDTVQMAGDHGDTHHLHERDTTAEAQQLREASGGWRCRPSAAQLAQLVAHVTKEQESAEKEI